MNPLMRAAMEIKATTEKQEKKILARIQSLDIGESGGTVYVAPVRLKVRNGTTIYTASTGVLRKGNL